MSVFGHPLKTNEKVCLIIINSAVHFPIAIKFASVVQHETP